MAAPQTLEDFFNLDPDDPSAPPNPDAPASTVPGNEQTPINQIPTDTTAAQASQKDASPPADNSNAVPTPDDSATSDQPTQARRSIGPAAIVPSATDPNSSFDRRTGLETTVDPVTGTATTSDPYKTTPADDSSSQKQNNDYDALNTLIQQLIAAQSSSAASDADYRNNIKNSVLSLIKSGSAPVDPNDPTILSATQAFRGEGERALALLQEKQAEASKASGRTAGSVESAMKGGYEDLGNAEGSYAANLQIQELNARRQELVQATQIGAGVSNADESNALQSQIASIDAQIKELSLKQTDTGMSQQNTQFYDSLANTMGTQTNTLDELLSQYLLGSAA